MTYGPKQTLREGFEKFVIRNTEGCWGWKGCCPKNPGYGQFRASMKLVRSHRASWELHYGPIPNGMSVLHRCDNYICSNPEHLFLGNNIDNIRDMISKGRHPTLGKCGEKNHRASLTSQQVKEIRNEYSTGNISQISLAKKYSSSRMTICRIINNLTWKDLQ